MNTNITTSESQNSQVNNGILSAVSSYVIWGMFPLYFYLIKAIPASEVMAHRVVGALIIVLIYDFIKKPKVRWFDMAKDIKVLGFCLLTTFLLSVNWLVSMWAVMNGYALEASLGFFMNPLVSVFIGMLFFKEKPSTLQAIAIAIALVAVVYLTVAYNKIPIIPLVLSFSFALYGTLRKSKGLHPFAGLTVETIIATPFAIAYLVYIYMNGTMQFGRPDMIVANIGVVLSGLFTIVPLILFLSALPKIKLSTVGILQYITPTLHFILAVTILGESLSVNKLVAFIMIWISIFIFMIPILKPKKLKPKKVLA